MSVAIGSRSTISYAEEIIYKQHPLLTDYRAINFNSETLGESIKTIVSDAIDRRRIVPSVRGGNIAAQGDISAEFYPKMVGTWLKHLLTCVPDTTVIVPKTLANLLVVVRGDYVQHLTNVYLVANAGGTITTLAPVLTHTFGVETLDGTVFEYAGTASVSSNIVFNDVDDEIEHAAHGYTNGKVVWFTAMLLPTGISALVGYYINASLATDPLDRYSIHLTLADALAGTNKILFSDVGNAVKVYPAKYFNHVFTGDVLKPCGGLSIEKRIVGSSVIPCVPEDLYWMFNGCRINTLELKIPQEGIIMASWGFLATRVDEYITTSRAASISSATEDSVVGYQTFINIDGTDSTVMSAGSLNINNNYDESVYVIGDRYRHDLPEGRRQITGNFDIYFENKQMYEIFKEEKTVAVNIDIYHLGNFARFEMPQCKFTGGTPTPLISGNGVISSSFQMNAFLRDYDSPGYDIRVILRNQISAY